MSSMLQLNVHHLVNAYEIEAGIGVIAGKTVWSMPERLRVLQKWALYKYTYISLYLFNKL